MVQPGKDERSIWLWNTESCSSRRPVFKALGLFLFFPACGKLCFRSVSGERLESKVKFFQDKFIVSDLGEKKSLLCLSLKCILNEN